MLITRSTVSSEFVPEDSSASEEEIELVPGVIDVPPGVHDHKPMAADDPVTAGAT